VLLPLPLVTDGKPDDVLELDELEPEVLEPVPSVLDDVPVVLVAAAPAPLVACATAATPRLPAMLAATRPPVIRPALRRPCSRPVMTSSSVRHP
jgi:hypothetical protein